MIADAIFGMAFDFAENVVVPMLPAWPVAGAEGFVTAAHTLNQYLGVVAGYVDMAGVSGMVAIVAGIELQLWFIGAFIKVKQLALPF